MASAQCWGVGMHSIRPVWRQKIVGADEVKTRSADLARGGDVVGCALTARQNEAAVREAGSYPRQDVAIVGGDPRNCRRHGL